MTTPPSPFDMATAASTLGPLEDAFAEVKKLVDEEIFREHGASSFHRGLGMHIRNTWGLWEKKGAFYDWCKSIGLWHADDMSGLLLESYHRHLEGKPLDIEGQVKHYQAHWEKMGVEEPED